MILTDCTACADERAAGAAFCEVCGRQLAAPRAEADATVVLPSDATTVELPSPEDPPAAGNPAAGDETTGQNKAGDDTAGQHKAGEAAPKSAKDWMDCPHCGADKSVGADGYCEECGMLAGRPRDHLEADGGAAGAAVSDRGRRHHRNEDAMWLAVGDQAADVVVCDGVSASYDPDAASDLAARTAGELLAVAQHPSGVPDAEVEAAAAETTTVLDPGAEATTVLNSDAEATTVLNPDAEATTVLNPDAEATAVLPAGDRTVDLGTAGAAGADRDASRVPEKSDPESPGPAIAVAGVVAGSIAAAAEAVASLAHTGDPRRAASNPACTIVAAAVRGPHVGFGWVGDSRAYWLGPDGPAEQLTEDDSWAQHVIALGVDPQVAMNDPKAHAITAWLGADAGPVRPRVGAFTVTEPGLLVLCSDGLWNYLVDPAVFADVVRSCVGSSASLLEAARALVAFANKAGGADNITVALVPVHPD
jgi:serine/threonine protein phosphatase PrpC